MQICKDFGNLPVQNPHSIPLHKASLYNRLVVPTIAKGRMSQADQKLIKQTYNLRRLYQFPGHEIHFRSTDYMNSRFYGPLPFKDVDPYNKAKHIGKKKEKVKQIMNEATASDQELHRQTLVEIMFLLRKGTIGEGDDGFKNEVDKTSYTGIDET